MLLHDSTARMDLRCLYANQCHTPQKFITKVHITNYEHYRHKIEFPILRAVVFSMSIVYIILLQKGYTIMASG